MVFAYLSLERQEDALRIVSQYVEQCRYAVSYINNHAEMFEYDFRERICYWEKKCREAVMLKKVIQTDGGREFELEIRKREKDSDELCRQFFHLF